MIVYVGLILILALYGVKFCGNGTFAGYLSPKSSNAIKGIFILLIFVSHFSYYVETFTAPLDLAYVQLRAMLGQGVVVYFLFSSGYGVMLSAATKGEEYMKGFPRKRILATLLAYDLAQVLFLLMELGRGRSFSLSHIILTFLSWETFGDGIDNWYIFIILSLYLISWLALRGRKADKPAAAVVTAASFAMIAVLACVKPRHWFNTLLCYSLGMWYYLYQEKIDEYMKHNAHYWKTAVVLGLLFVFFHKFWYLRPVYLTTMLLFALGVVVITMKVQVNNRFLIYCGKHIQGLFLLHRIPMTILGDLEFMRGQPHLWFISSVVLTFALEYLFNKSLAYMRGAPLTNGDKSRIFCAEAAGTEQAEEEQPESATPQQDDSIEMPIQAEAETSISAKAADVSPAPAVEPGENTVLTVHDVSIRYLLGDFKDIGLKEYVMRQVKGDYHITEFWADHHISFSLERGDMLGIIGTNGAGKSTLLKAISGIMEPTGGYVERKGNISALLELASGFDGDLTVRENAYLRGAMLGYTRKFMDEKYPEIIEFAELQDFQDRPFKQLSSGMMSRLAFAVASLVHPDILILDEVLSVGDGAFRKKSEDKMREIMGGGTTTILVSHSVEQVREMCNKVLWIEKGNQIGFGDAETLCGLYQQFLNGEISLHEARRILGTEGEMDRPEDRFVTKTVSDRSVWVARLKRYAYLPLCFLALLGTAGAFHMMYGLPFYSSITVPLMIGWSLLFTSIAAILPGIAKKIYLGLLGGVFAVLPIVHEVYTNMFRKFFSFADMAFAGDGFAFLDSSYLVFNRPVLLLSMLFLAAMVGCILLTRKFKLSKTVLWAGAVGVLAGAVLIAGVCLKSFRGDGRVVWDMNEDPTTIYKSFTDRKASLSLLGLYHYTFRDIQLALFPSGEALSSDELAEIDAYAATRGHEDNELTGALAGKNLILVQLEAIDTWMLEDYMPALKAVKEQSIVFANHYTPAYITAGTFNTEFMVNTGLMPAATGTSTGVYVQNAYPSSLAHLFADRGYTANSFHGSEANVYNRGAVHEVWGYKYHSGNDMGLENFTMDSQLTTAYKDMTPSSPFFTFIITYSGHGPYGDTNPTYLAHADAAWAQAKRTDGNYVYAVAHAMETDQFVADLMRRLEADGLLENTAVVFYADHYNYYMMNDALQMDIKGVDSMNLLQHTDFFVYSKDLEPRTVEKYTSSLDVLPTLANLFDLDADYAHLAGDDAFSSGGGYVIFNDNTWLGTDRDVSAEIMRRRRINTLLLKGNYWREKH